MRCAYSTLVSALLAVCLALPRAASAQSIPSPFRFIEERQEAGLFVGYMSSGSGRFGFGPDGGLMFGTRYAVELAGPIALEGTVAGMRGTRDVINPARPEGDRAIGEAHVMLTMIDARLRLAATGARTWHGLAPFLSFGGGVAFDTAKRSIAEGLLDPDQMFEFGTKFYAVASPGIKWHLSRHLAVRTDAGLTLWKINTPSGFGDPNLNLQNVAKSEWVSGLSLTGSVLFRW